MLKTIAPALSKTATQSLPSLLMPLVLALEDGCPLLPAIEGTVNALGFDSFMYGMSTASYPLRDSRTYVWTTLPKEWVQIYDQNAYVEVDPRLTQCWQRVTPLIWDQTIAGNNERVTRFLDHAAQYGIGSGVVIPLRDPLHPLVLVAFNSSNRVINAKRRLEIDQILGQIVLLASHFHEYFMASFVDAGMAPRHQGSSLSPREVQCLQFAARGLTSGDIALRLGLVERTVNFHFCNILSKLAAANRGEAIATALSRHIIGP